MNVTVSFIMIEERKLLSRWYTSLGLDIQIYILHLLSLTMSQTKIYDTFANIIFLAFTCVHVYLCSFILVLKVTNSLWYFDGGRCVEIYDLLLPCMKVTFKKHWIFRMNSSYLVILIIWIKYLGNHFNLFGGTINVFVFAVNRSSSVFVVKRRKLRYH